MTELQVLIKMLDRVGVGYGLRHDYNPISVAVQIEHPDDEGDGFHVTEWIFDETESLKDIIMYRGEKG